MGFYAPAQIVRDAREHGVEVRPVCVNASQWDCTLEPASLGRRAIRDDLSRSTGEMEKTPPFSPLPLAGEVGSRSDPGEGLALRLGFRMVKGLSEDHGTGIVKARGATPYRDLENLHRRAGVPIGALGRLAEADAFRSLGLDRRAAVWAIRGLSEPLPLFAAADSRAAMIEPATALPRMTEAGEVVQDYRSIGLSLRRHPAAFLRPKFRRAGMIACADLAHARDGQTVTVPGIVLVRQRPGSARGVLFMTIEDETGIANLIVWPSLFERQRRLILTAGMLACRGRVQREGIVIHVVAQHLTDFSDDLRRLGQHEAVLPAGPDIRGPGIKVPTRDFR